MSILDSLDRLRTQLVTSGLQRRDNPLFQVINQLISTLRSIGDLNTTQIINVESGLKNATYVTFTNQLATLPFSRVITAGSNISLDLSTPGQVIINSTGGGGSQWSVLTNGNADNPDLIYADGDVIMTETP